MNKQKLLYADSSFEKLRDFENALAAVDAMNRCDLKTAHLLKKAGMEQQVFTLYASNAAFAGGMDAAVLFKEYANKAGVKMEVS
ncbi:MAG: hypothetical protein V2J65_06710 [Desulfobacteraceae bacterium]|jgi:hypothetical protein|nr:hypothetical protein [Desulfobacteraceae bacterium]